VTVSVEGIAAILVREAKAGRPFDLAIQAAANEARESISLPVAMRAFEVAKAAGAQFPLSYPRLR
jgi:Flp pilus assembly protein TadB